MEQERNLLLNNSMIYGLIMGTYWVVKYIFFIGSVSYPSASFIYWGMTLSVPFLLYSLMKHFRISTKRPVGFMELWRMGVLIFFFSALIVSLAHFVFYRFLAPPDLIVNSMEFAKNIIDGSQLSSEVKESFRSVGTPTPILMTLQGIVNNVIGGIFISIPIAAIVSRKGLNTPFEKNTNKE